MSAWHAERDGYEASANDVFLTSGASEGIANVLEAIIAGPNVGVSSMQAVGLSLGEMKLGQGERAKRGQQFI